LGRGIANPGTWASDTKLRSSAKYTPITEWRELAVLEDVGMQ